MADTTAKPTPRDLTGRARIRNSALTLFADRGTAATSMRQIADKAGVTVGLVTHHFATKKQLREAVDEYVIERYRETLSAVPPRADAHELFAARDRAVTDMLRDDVDLQNYLRQACLNPADGEHDLLERLIDFSREEVHRLRELGVASTEHSVEEQVIRGVVRQQGALLLEPLISRSWQHLGGDPHTAPRVHVTTVRPHAQD